MTSSQDAERLIFGVSNWAKTVTPDQAESEKYQQALKALDGALAATIKYIKKVRDNDRNRDPRAEDYIADLWQAAGQKVGPLDYDLSNACFMKGLGWIDQAVWDRAHESGIKIGIPEMENARMQLNLKQAELRHKVPAWFPIAGVVFTAITILFLMYLLLAGPPIEAQKKTVFDVLVAICVAASAAFVGGTAIAKGKIPLIKQSPIEFSSAGGIAVFIIVYLLMRYGT